MKRSISSVLVAGSAVFAAHAETTVVPMDDASWGYVVKGLGEAGHERAYVFTNTTAAMSWTAPVGTVAAELLVVGGGGAGGNGDAGGWGDALFGGGGGGAGGFRHVEAQQVVPLQDYAVTVGRGATSYADRKGGDSAFDAVVALGGGCGGFKSAGCDGGSGGGGSSGVVGHNLSVTPNQGGSAIDAAAGHDGGCGKVDDQHQAAGYGTGGGGGGAGAAGADAPDNDNGADGGTGIQCAITGEDAWYCSGGGGAANSVKDSHYAGQGGPGAGDAGRGTSGLDATGYGCGGGGGAGPGNAGGKGFQGVVVVRVSEHDWEWTEGEESTFTTCGWSNGTCRICHETTHVEFPKLRNRWIVEPSVSSTEWIAGDAPADLAINLGEALSGEVVCNRTVEQLRNLSVGDYDVIFTAGEEGGETIAKTNVVRIIAASVEIDLTNEDGSQIDWSLLSAGSTVKLNFRNNDNVYLVLSVAYGRYDKIENYTQDADTMEKARDEGRDYDAENYGGWDYFEPIDVITNGQSSYVYTIPYEFGKLYAQDSHKEDIPAQFQRLTDKIRFFLTPMDQTPMKTLRTISGTHPDKQYVNTGITPNEYVNLTLTSLSKVEGGTGGVIIDTARDKTPEPYLVYNISVTGDGVIKYNLRDSDTTPNPGTDSTVIKEDTANTPCILKASSNYKLNMAMTDTQNRLRVGPADADGEWNYYSERATDLATAEATGPVVLRGASVSFNRLSLSDASYRSVRYMMASMGFNRNGELVAGLYDSITHRFFASEGGEEFVAGEEDYYHKDLMKDVPVRGQTDTMICHIHVWDVENALVVEPPTCTRPGRGVAPCKTPGCSWPVASNEVVLAALGHEWSEWVREKEPSCSETGYEVRTCLREDCDHVRSAETNTVVKVPHQRIFVKDANGRRYYVCSECGTEESEALTYGRLWNWLQSDGSGYVKTDCKVNYLTTRIEMDTRVLTPSQNGCYYSTEGNEDDDDTIMMRYWGRTATSSEFATYYNFVDKCGGENSIEVSFPGAFDRDSTFRHKVVTIGGTGSVKGVAGVLGDKYKGKEPYDKVSSGALVFFCDLGNTNFKLKAKTFSARVYEVVDGVETLVHDYVPATVSGKNAGFWDRVTNKYWPATTNGFSAGDEQGLKVLVR